jgi:hypothetical protein
MIGELCTDISNRLGTFIEQVGDFEQAEESAKGVCGRARKRQRPEPSIVVDEEDAEDADDEDYNADGNDDDEEDEDADDEDDEGDDDSDNEDGASKEQPSNGQHIEDDDFQDRDARFDNTPRRSPRFDNTPRRSARLGNLNTQSVGAANTPLPGLSPFSDIRGFAASRGKDIDMTNNQGPKFFDITEKIYPNSIFMEEIARSQRGSPTTTPPLDQFSRDTVVQKVQTECIAFDKLAIRGDKGVQMKQKMVAHRTRPLDTNVQSEIVQDQVTVQSANQTATHNTGAAPQPPPDASHAVSLTKIPAQALFIRTSPRRNKNTPTSPATPSTCQGSQTNSAAKKSTVPTRQTCPPPRAKDPRWEKGCDPPSFSLGFDSPQKSNKQTPVVAASDGTTPQSFRSFGSPIFDDYEDVWSPEMEEEAIALCTKVEREKGYLTDEADTIGAGHQSEAELQTPTPVGNKVTPSMDGSGSNSNAPPGRIIRPAACYKSPYIDFSSKNTYACSADVKEVYDLVISGGKRNGRGQHKDNTPIIVNFEKFFVSHQELANSMMPCAELDNTVFELGLESIMLRKDKNDKKVVMPLRFMVSTPTPFFVSVFVLFLFTCQAQIFEAKLTAPPGGFLKSFL